MGQKKGFQQRVMEFMQGRYGVDQLSNFLLWIGVILALLTMFMPYRIFVIVSWVLIIYAYVRILSKDTSKRYAQNQKFLDKTFGIRNAFAKIKYRIKYGKQATGQYRIYCCKKCGQKIRIPKGKGKIMITCPKCKYQFKKRS